MASARLFPVLALLALACGEASNSNAGSAPPAAPPAGWAERFALVRADLEQVQQAHLAKDLDGAVASWDQAYRQRFEPLIERPVGERVDGHALMATEYAFGRLRDGLESPREGPVKSALAELRQQLDTLEPLVVALPAPTN